MFFDELPLSDGVLDALWDMHFDTCTPVQEQTIPIILQGKDVISCAQTGTGKTAAYILPLLTNLEYDNHDPNKLNAIIMAPTRELAQQIDQQMEGFGFYVPFSSVAIYGGNDGGAWGTQVAGLQRGADIVIATPGRLLSQMNIYDIDFSGVKYFILDEADRMLDMGFYDDIITIADLLPDNCQKIFFSATMPTKIEEMAKRLMHNPQIVKIAVSKPAEKIRQLAYTCQDDQKVSMLKKVFKEFGHKRVIVFAGSKNKVKEINRNLKQMDLRCEEMHSDLTQTQRDEAMYLFKSGQTDVLVATDIVSRGIDIDDIAMVVNYDVPHDAEDYIHRIGRTARAEREGTAVTLINGKDMRAFRRIEQLIGKRLIGTKTKTRTKHKCASTKPKRNNNKNS